jgi:hypothetical protein
MRCAEASSTLSRVVLITPSRASHPPVSPDWYRGLRMHVHWVEFLLSSRILSLVNASLIVSVVSLVNLPGRIF